MYSYVAHGLSVHSDIPLPDFVPSPLTNADVVIRLSPIDRSRPEIANLKNSFHATTNRAHFAWDTIGAIEALDGREIVVDPIPEAEESLVRAAIAGIVMAILLHQRGLFVLHASAIACSGGGVAFIGEKGYGKSTMAATLYGRGHTLLADDVVVLEVGRSGEPVVLPAFPQFKLLPESAIAALGEDPDQLPRLASTYEKRTRHAHERFAVEAAPLKRIYALAIEPDLAVVALPPREAVVQLMVNSIAGRYRDQLLPGIEAVHHLRRCASLLEHVGVYRLERPRSLDLLPEVARLVEEQCEPDYQPVRARAPADQ